MSRLRSMTAYGRGVHTGAHFRVTAEVRSVNHRFRDVVVRAPRELHEVAERIRGRVAECVERGRVEVYLSAEPLPGSRQLKVDMDLGLAYYKALENLREHLGLESPATLDLVVQFPDIIGFEPFAQDTDALWSDMGAALDAALEDLLAMRAEEGEALLRDALSRLERVDELLEAVARRAPAVTEHHRSRLQQRLAELLPEAGVDEDRLVTEVTLLAERSDISEEIVRLRSHREQFGRTLEAEGAVGRKLEFLLQEMHREVNTVGSKAHDQEISAAVVEIKTQLEKLREQAQNLE